MPCCGTSGTSGESRRSPRATALLLECAGNGWNWVRCSLGGLLLRLYFRKHSLYRSSDLRIARMRCVWRCLVACRSCLRRLQLFQQPERSTRRAVSGGAQSYSRAEVVALAASRINQVRALLIMHAVLCLSAEWVRQHNGSGSAKCELLQSERAIGNAGFAHRTRAPRPVFENTARSGTARVMCVRALRET